MLKNNTFCRTAAFLSALGSIQLGLWGIKGVNFISHMAGDSTLSARLIYGVFMGVGILLLFTTFGSAGGSKKDLK